MTTKADSTLSPIPEDTCVECDDPIAKYVIITASPRGNVERHYCRVCYLCQP